MNESVEAHRLRTQRGGVGGGQQSGQQGRANRGVLRYDREYIFGRHDGRVCQPGQQRLEDLRKRSPVSQSPCIGACGRQRALCSESDNTRSRAMSSIDVPRDNSAISRSSSGAISWRDVSSVGETPKPLARLAIGPSSVVESSPALCRAHEQRADQLGEGYHTS